VTGPNTESLPRVSPNGKWLAYQSNETGRFEIYVRPFPAAGARVQVSDNGGTETIWGRDGRSLYYRGPVGEVVRVDVTTAESFSIGARTVQLSGDYLTDASHPNWDIAPDGRFLMLKRAGAESQTIVVHNWARELREKTAGRR
jgi:Tol biopolymer transport system component